MCNEDPAYYEIREELKGLLCELKEKYQDQDEASTWNCSVRL